MSMLERLTVRGIRNFGVDAEDEQKITFSTPLTLILGQNGSGKTTIIECIKYALTGDFPPNSQKGVGFINNPHVLHTTESLGQVKLRLKNLRGNDITVSRSGKVIKKNEKLQFKSLDVTISLNENGREIQTSKRLEDATVDMCVAMGVSKAIINHVLFCHQEESSWPLGTDVEVMKIFDEIFGTTEYNNALDKMRAMRKKYEASVKEKKVDLKELEMIKEQTDKKTMEINKHVDEIEQMKQKIDEGKTKLEPLNEEYKQIVKIGEQMSSITASKAKVEAELKNKTENAQKLTLKIKTPFNGTESELLREIEKFHSDRANKKIELEDKEDVLQTEKYEFGESTKKVDEHDRKHHSLVMDRQREKELYEQKVKYIKNMCTKLKMNVTLDLENVNDERTVAELVANIKAEMVKVDGKIKEMIATNEREDEKLEKEIRKYSDEESRIEAELHQIVNRLKELKQTLAQQSEELRKIERSTGKLKDVQDNIAKCQKRYEDMKAEEASQGIGTQIADRRDEKQRLSDELEGIDMQITELSTMATLLAQVSTKQKHLEQKEAEVTRLTRKHADSLQQLMPNERLGSGIKRKIEAMNTDLRIKANRLEAEGRRKDSQEKVARNQQQHKKQELSKLEAELRQSEEEIDRECDSTPFNEYLAMVKEQVDKNQMEYSEMKSSEVFFKNYIKRLEERPHCPLCHKDMVHNEVDDLSQELQSKIDALPENIERSEQSLMESRTKLEKLLGMQASVDRIDKIKTDLIPHLKDELKKIESDLVETQEKSKKANAEADETKAKMLLIAPMIGDLSILDEILRDVEQTRKDLEPLRRKLPSGGAGGGDGSTACDMDALQKKRKEITDRIKCLDKEIADKEKKRSDDEKIMNQFKEKTMDLRNFELELKGDIQKVDGLRAREKELRDEIAKLQETEMAKNEQLIPIKGKILNAEDKRRFVKNEGVKSVNKEKIEYEKLQKDFNNIDNLSKELDKLAERNLADEIKRYEKLLEQLRNDKAKQASQIESIRQEIKVLTKELAEQDNVERDLNDNLELKRTQKEIADKENELETLRKNERDVDFGQIAEKKARLAHEIDRLVIEKTRLEGQITEKNKMINATRTEIGQPKYRDSVKNYKKAFYENVILTKTIEDLTTYCATLEKALTKFHSDKMEKINGVIRNLWRTIYKGNDIDYIQINTEEVKGTLKRRSYTYRVVASKNDSFIDFRGHSSAGQRVLACLIIRIALAETFSGHCGVLALDEPTTNLDQLNIEALCSALNDIVTERESQSNFMLIVITHDETFINALGRVDYYYRIYRDNNGKSRTQRLRNS